MQPPIAHSDVFPSTMSTWLAGRVRDGESGVRDAGRHVMDVYAHPLRVYLLGSGFRTLGDPDELVNGFFADRLSRPNFLQRWIESRRPLRYWLIVGFKHFLYEHARRLRRADFDELSGSISGDEESASRIFDREVARAVVNEAMKRAEGECRQAGLDRHWAVFRRHFLDGRPFAAVGAEFDVAAERAAVMARTAAHRFKRALRDLVSWDGASDEQVDQEITHLMESLS